MINEAKRENSFLDEWNIMEALLRNGLFLFVIGEDGELLLKRINNGAEILHISYCGNLS